MALSQQDIEEMDAISGLGGMSATSDVHPAALSRAKELDELDKSSLRKGVDTAKAAVGGIGHGVGGIALTGIDYLGRKAVEKNPFSSPETKVQQLKNLDQAGSLHDQFKEQMGGDIHPDVYGAGELAGEIGALATPVGALGKGTRVMAEAIPALGKGSKIAKLTQAGVEGAAFTAGQGLTEGKNETLSDYAINTGLNMAFPGVGMAAKAVAEKVPARIINSLIKPLSKDFAYGKNPGKSVAELGITGNDFEELISNIKTKKNDIGAQLGSVVSQSPGLAQIDLVQTLSPIDEAIKIANKAPRTNATLLSRLESVKSDLVDNLKKGMNPQEFKGVIGDLTKWTGNASDDAAINKALKQVYGSTRSEMDKVLSKELTPEQFKAYKKNAEHYGNLISAENAAIYRDKINERQNLISFGAKNMGLLTGLTAAVATGGAAVPAILAGLAGTVVDKAMATPAFKTRLASLLTKMGPTEVSTFFEKVPTAKQLFKEEELKNLIDKAKPKNGMYGGFVNPSEIIRTATGKFDGVADKFSKYDYNNMTDFLDYAHKAKKVTFDEAIKLEEKAQTFLRDQGIKIPNTKTGLRDAVQKILDKSNFPEK